MSPRDDNGDFLMQLEAVRLDLTALLGRVQSLLEKSVSDSGDSSASYDELGLVTWGGEGGANVDWTWPPPKSTDMR
jgi:hypothetical protein